MLKRKAIFITKNLIHENAKKMTNLCITYTGKGFDHVLNNCLNTLSKLIKKNGGQ